jgi:hypothetical protein
MPAPVPEIIQPLLAEYMSLLDEKLPGFISASYLQGSIALGAFNERHSDIDLIAFLGRGWTPGDLEILKEIHNTVNTTYPRWPLEVAYLQWPGLTDPEQVVRPYLQYLAGQLGLITDFDLDEVTCWVLKNRGIALRGPEPQDLGFEVDWGALIAAMHHNHNTYWVQFTTNPRRMAYMLTNEGLQWAVLGALRQLYSFKEQTVTSKTGAGHYALQHLPSKWHRLIQEALNIREKEQPSLYKSKVRRANAAVRFLRYVGELCNRLP